MNGWEKSCWWKQMDRIRGLGTTKRFQSRSNTWQWNKCFSSGLRWNDPGTCPDKKRKKHFITCLQTSGWNYSLARSLRITCSCIQEWVARASVGTTGYHVLLAPQAVRLLDQFQCSGDEEGGAASVGGGGLLKVGAALLHDMQRRIHIKKNLGRGFRLNWFDSSSL